MSLDPQEPVVSTPEPQPTLGAEIREHLVEEGRIWLRWAFGGAVLGAVGLGVLGAMTFGPVGLLAGLAVGAVAGGIGGGIFYYSASSLL